MRLCDKPQVEANSGSSDPGMEHSDDFEKKNHYGDVGGFPKFWPNMTGEKFSGGITTKR